MKEAVYGLHKQHKTHPIWTMLAPVAVNVPLLIAASWGVRNALVTHPEIAQATGLWFSSFGEPDSSGILEIGTAMLAMGNIELMKRANAVRKQLYGSVVDAEGEVQRAQQAQQGSVVSDNALAEDSAAASSKPPAPGPAPPSANPQAAQGSRVFGHRPTPPPASPSDKRSLSSSPPAAKKARSRAPRAVSQIPVAGRPGTPGNPVEVQIPSSALRQKRAPTPMPGKDDMTHVTRSKAFAFAVKDRDRITKGLTNFFSVLAIAIVPIGLWTPSVSRASPADMR